jgi:hypothetical protein
MDLRAAAKIATGAHVKRALDLYRDKGGLDWLYQQTGRSEPRYRYIVIDGERLPTKAFGCLVAQIAGDTQTTSNDLTTNDAAGILKRAGYVEVKPSAPRKTAREQDEETESYYKQLARPRQAQFRAEMMAIYSGQCPLSGCSIPEALEAAHIDPFAGGGRSNAENGILLRVDLHKLFDAGKLAIDPESQAAVFASDCAEHYSKMQHRKLRLPNTGPSWEAFRSRWQAMKTGLAT